MRRPTSCRFSLNLRECGFGLQETYYSTFARWLKATGKAFSANWRPGAEIALNRCYLRAGHADCGGALVPVEFNSLLRLSMMASTASPRRHQRGGDRYGNNLHMTDCDGLCGKANPRRRRRAILRLPLRLQFGRKSLWIGFKPGVFIRLKKRIAKSTGFGRLQQRQLSAAINTSLNQPACWRRSKRRGVQSRKCILDLA